MEDEASDAQPVVLSPATLALMDDISEALDTPPSSDCPSSPSDTTRGDRPLSPEAESLPVNNMDDETSSLEEFDFQQYENLFGETDHEEESNEIPPSPVAEAAACISSPALRSVVPESSSIGSGDGLPSHKEDKELDVEMLVAQVLPLATSPPPLIPDPPACASQETPASPQVLEQGTAPIANQPNQLQFPIPVPQTQAPSPEGPKQPQQQTPTPNGTPSAQAGDPTTFQHSNDANAVPVSGDSPKYPPLEVGGDGLLFQPYKPPYNLDQSTTGGTHGVANLTRLPYPIIQWFSASEWATSSTQNTYEAPGEEDEEAEADGPMSGYPDHPRPDAWGPGRCANPPSGLEARSQPIFRYSSRGQWSAETYFTSEELRYYVGMCPRDLKIWIQNVPHKHDRQDEWDMICRWDQCPHKGAIIKPGFLRCTFDEYPHATESGGRDPFAVAGCMHLYCFEQVFDVAKLHRRKRLFPDVRRLPGEWGRKNPIALNRLPPDRDIVRSAYLRWIESRPHLDRIPANWWKPVPHEQSLGYALTLYHCTTSLKRDLPGTQFAGNGGVKQGQILSMEEHLGDLVKWLKSIQDEKDQRRFFHARTLNPAADPRQANEQPVHQSSSSLTSLQSMSAAPDLQLGDEESSDEDSESSAPSRLTAERFNIEAFCDHRTRNGQQEYLVKWHGYAKKTWETASELAEDLTPTDLFELVQPLLSRQATKPAALRNKRKRWDDDEFDSETASRNKRKRRHDDEFDYETENAQGHGKWSGKKARMSTARSSAKRKGRHDESDDEEPSRPSKRVAMKQPRRQRR